MEKNKIYNMDCALGLDQMISDGTMVDCILTSPPYNITRHTCDQGYDVYVDQQKNNDEYASWIVSLIEKSDKILAKNGKILLNLSYGAENTECMNITIAEILKKTKFTLGDIIIWRKTTATPNNVSQSHLTRICEFVYVLVRRDEFYTYTSNKKPLNKRKTGQTMYENVFNFIDAPNNDEPCPLNRATFSVSFCNQLLGFYCKKGDCVLDIFMGTGTTAVSAKGLGMDYIGFELSKEQCEWAEKRLSTIDGKAKKTSYSSDQLSLF